jgi:serine/threonine protein kinase
MENINDQESIDSKYIILDKKGFGATADVYLVKEANHDDVYAAKVLKKHSDLFDKEIKILNTLKTANNPYIVNIINSGEGLVKKKNHEDTIHQYLVLQYASKGELFDYIYHAKAGLSERHAKVVFAKILKGVEACHNSGICHRDLKMQNILVDQNFAPKICDFGFATQNNDHLDEYLGTRNYASPEILRNKPYDGFKADIFSLGVVLLTLTTCKIGFVESTKFDPYYRLIMTKHFEKYWAAVSSQITGISDELKNLFIKMVSFRPSDRPSIKEILEGEWMKEIREMNDEQLAQLENEIREEFLKREAIVNNATKQQMEVEEGSSESCGNRGANDGEEYFDLNLKPQYAQTGLKMNNYIKLTGNVVPSTFMNALANKINNEFSGQCNISANPEKLKFNAIFEEEQLDEEIPEDMKEELKKLGIEDDEEIQENENIKGKKTVMQIKIFESQNGGYLLRFVRKEGDQNDYLEKMSKIYSLVKQN